MVLAMFSDIVQIAETVQITISLFRASYRLPGKQQRHLDGFHQMSLSSSTRVKIYQAAELFPRR
jgi:hypothetical protein